jgi:hypothetical protein
MGAFANNGFAEQGWFISELRRLTKSVDSPAEQYLKGALGVLQYRRSIYDSFVDHLFELHLQFYSPVFAPDQRYLKFQE